MIVILPIGKFGVAGCAMCRPRYVSVIVLLGKMFTPLTTAADFGAALIRARKGLGLTALRYEAAWRGGPERFPISLGMPLTSPEYGPYLVVPWLINLLPEGDPLRATTRALGVARDAKREGDEADIPAQEPVDKGRT